MTPTHVPVVIVGGGPTGITTAIMLGQRGIECLVLERWNDVYPLPRAVHFDDEVFRIFASMGLEDEVRAISRPAPGMQLTDAEHRVLADFRRDPNRQVHGYPQANMFDQPDLERTLREGMKKHPSVSMISGVAVDEIVETAGGPGRVRLSYRDADQVTGQGFGEATEIWADFVLGCDGANSIARAVVGATMEDFDFEQQWLVVDVVTPEPLKVYDGVQQVCDHDRAATFMPVVPGRYRWEFRLRDGERAEDLHESDVIDRIRPWLGTVDVEKVSVVRKTGYTFRGVVADRWRKGRVFLVGDAAHQTPPFIGQGLCAGIRDASNLAWKVALVVNGQADDRILATYEDERKPYARRVVQLAIAIGWLMTGGTARTAGVRRTAMRLTTRIPGVEEKVVAGAWPAFRPGPLVDRKRRRRVVGDLLPQPSVNLGGKDVRLDDLLGGSFAVLSRNVDTLDAFDEETKRYFRNLGTKFVQLDELEGPTEEIESALKKAKANALLIRPDRIVASSSKHTDLRAWRQQLEAAGISTARIGADR